MKQFLFHSDVFMPARYAAPCHEGKLTYSGHARREAASDRYGNIDLPDVFTAGRGRLIETEVQFDGDEARVVKQLWRQPLDEGRDLVMAIVPGGRVKTVWVNRTNDKHRSLDRSRYVHA
jgi:hypothetical protein